VVTPASEALLALGRELQARGYRFVSVTPETQRRVNERAERLQLAAARELRDVFGWNRVFAPEALPAHMLRLLERADALERLGPRSLRSRVRFSSLNERLFVHSGYPTTQADAIFFGPDTYRFCALLRRWAPPARSVLDLGCGTGAGGISCAAGAERLVLADINPSALHAAEVNAALAGVTVELAHSDLARNVAGQFDLIIANPPYMRDVAGRVYRDGGGDYGEALAVRIVREAVPRLRPGGMLIVYSGSAIVDGVDVFERQIVAELAAQRVSATYEEVDPDVFGEELEQPGYERVERIAAVGLRVCVN
jgi:release factor glutamine methyltransferase